MCFYEGCCMYMQYKKKHSTVKFMQILLVKKTQQNMLVSSDVL